MRAIDLIGLHYIRAFTGMSPYWLIRSVLSVPWQAERDYQAPVDGESVDDRHTHDKSTKLGTRRMLYKLHEH